MLWAIDPARLADELAALGVVGPVDRRLAALTPSQRVLVSHLDALAAATGIATRGPGSPR